MDNLLCCTTTLWKHTHTHTLERGRRQQIWPTDWSEIVVSRCRGPKWRRWWPEEQREGCWSLAVDSLSQLPPGTGRGLGASSCRLGSENQNRRGIHPSPNKLHSADKSKASWWCCTASFSKDKWPDRKIKKSSTTLLMYTFVHTQIYLFTYSLQLTRRLTVIFFPLISFSVTHNPLPK